MTKTEIKLLKALKSENIRQAKELGKQDAKIIGLDNADVKLQILETIMVRHGMTGNMEEWLRTTLKGAESDKLTIRILFKRVKKP